MRISRTLSLLNTVTFKYVVSLVNHVHYFGFMREDMAMLFKHLNYIVGVIGYDDNDTYHDLLKSHPVLMIMFSILSYCCDLALFVCFSERN